LCLPVRPEVFAREQLDLADGWTRRWIATWKFDAERRPVACPVRDLATMPITGAGPFRRFSWRTGQRHRPGLQYMVSTGRHHGVESREEAQLLLHLDFAGDVVDVLGQPFELRFTSKDGDGRHIPDFLVCTGDETWLIDVRPARLIKAEDKVRFTASAEAAFAVGWRYVVVTGWRETVAATLDTLSAQRRPLADPLRLCDDLMAGVTDGPVPFGELVAAASVPAMARAFALHLLWHRRMGIDLATSLSDRSLVYGAAGGRR
jgi:hypothetical protein